MQLDKIVETTFLPPPVVTTHDRSCEVFEFTCRQNHGEYIPVFTGDGGYKDGTKAYRDYFIESSTRARASSFSKRFFESKVKAMKSCWDYFHNKKCDFVPKVTKDKNET